MNQSSSSRASSPSRAASIDSLQQALYLLDLSRAQLVSALNDLQFSSPDSSDPPVLSLRLSFRRLLLHFVPIPPCVWVITFVSTAPPAVNNEKVPSLVSPLQTSITYARPTVTWSFEFRIILPVSPVIKFFMTISGTDSIDSGAGQPST